VAFGLTICAVVFGVLYKIVTADDSKATIDTDRMSGRGIPMRNRGGPTWIPTENGGYWSKGGDIRTPFRGGLPGLGKRR
jgi:hypothetical protein